MALKFEWPNRPFKSVTSERICQILMCYLNLNKFAYVASCTICCSISVMVFCMSKQYAFTYEIVQNLFSHTDWIEIQCLAIKIYTKNTCHCLPIHAFCAFLLISLFCYDRSSLQYVYVTLRHYSHMSPIDNIWAVIIVWRRRRKIILHCIVYQS